VRIRGCWERRVKSRDYIIAPIVLLPLLSWRVRALIVSDYECSRDQLFLRSKRDLERRDKFSLGKNPNPRLSCFHSSFSLWLSFLIPD